MEKKDNNMKKKDKENKIVVWEGFKKELPWIFFWLLLCLMAYGYYQDKKICDEVLASPCDVCYKLNQTLMDSDYSLTDNVPSYISKHDVYINESTIPIEDKNPNARTMSDYRE